VRAAQSWVELLDAGDYAEALDRAAPLLRQMTGSAANWASFVAMARAEFPGQIDRTLSSVDDSPDVGAAPPGDYHSVAFLVGHEMETVVLVLDGDIWRVAMYGVR
jgi:hypothetical protein